jgi:hypothetical protein
MAQPSADPIRGIPIFAEPTMRRPALATDFIEREFEPGRRSPPRAREAQLLRRRERFGGGLGGEERGQLGQDSFGEIVRSSTKPPPATVTGRRGTGFASPSELELRRIPPTVT